MSKQKTATTTGNIRLDKWLWAARFFKTRALAKQAIEGGKVHYNGSRTRCSRAVECGAMLCIRLGFDEKTVEVLRLSDQRRGAPEAALLYAETEASIRQRERLADQRKALKGSGHISEGRPNKKDRRQISEFKERNRE